MRWQSEAEELSIGAADIYFRALRRISQYRPFDDMRNQPRAWAHLTCWPEFDEPIRCNERCQPQPNGEPPTPATI
ncbi:hypothetical protein PHLCEN_2v4776 [Hermanssonia centrifuga]|uniref:Uncharacterized protein n=1 Tax=Hermanssonia centrifuga TaxID=98765 RepID=A0A2R6PJ91_9APHY|nr:hypothetical protein PHLCEN_2v4776 [Hermanssonia centrifuga]